MPPFKPRSKCLYCDNLVKRFGSKYCSKSCLAKYNNPLTHTLPPLEPKVCARCKELFLAKERRDHLRAKYCSVECRHKCLVGIKRSLETRAKYSIAASKRNANRVYTKGIGGIRIDIGRYVRSSWEANICRLLNHLGINYEFEKHQFKLTGDNGEQIIYTPDCKIHNRFIEIKGWWNEKSLLIKRLMREQHPEIRITYIDEKFYNRLARKFGKQIPNWEFKTRNHKKGVLKQ